MNIFKRGLSLRSKIILPYFLIVLLLAFGVAYVGTRLVFDTIEERFVNQLIEAGKLSSNWMAQEEDRRLETLRLVARAQGITELIQTRNAEKLRELVYPIAVNAREQALVVLDAEGVALLSMYHVDGGKLEEYEFSRGDESFKQQPFIQAILKNTSDARGDKFADVIKNARNHYFFVAGPIIDAKSQVIGVVIVGKTLTTLATEIRQTTLAQVAFYHNDGTIYATTLAQTPALSSDIIASMTPSQSATRRFQAANIDYRQVVGSWKARGNRELGWQGIAFAENFLVRVSQNTWIIIFVAALIALLLVVVTGWFISGFIANPIVQLERAAARVAAGDLQVHVEPSGNDEVSSLTHRFNQMVTNLFRSQMDLIAAYDLTLEGWIKMLDLRDRETMGHSQRVTNFTLELARRLKVPEEQMDYVRRGALLHDIGKMAIPDAILLKDGPLTPEEWQVMRQHPAYAMQMLQEIPFLRPSVEIPYCHHEHWDGTGYPRGLRGDAIPLVARIFAVVDSWDALCSERPYRNALTPAQAREIIQQESGSRLDPEIVQAFFKLLDENGHKV